MLAQSAGGQLEAEDVLRTAAVGGEVEPLAVWREDRVVLVGLAGGDLVARRRIGEVDAEDLAVAGAHRGDENQGLAVGGEGGGAVEELVVGDVGDRPRLQVEDEDVELPAAPAVEGNGAAVG